MVLARDCGSAADPTSLQSRVAQWATQLAPGRNGHLPGRSDARRRRRRASAPAQECRLELPLPRRSRVRRSAAPNTLTGPARIVVEPIGNPLPTSLVGKRCADAVCDAPVRSPASTSSTRATAPARRSQRASTAASRASPRCPFPTTSARWRHGRRGRRRARAALRARRGGNVRLLPRFDWSGVLCQTDANCTFEGFPPPQLVRGGLPAVARVGPRRERTARALGRAAPAIPSGVHREPDLATGRSSRRSSTRPRRAAARVLRFDRRGADRDRIPPAGAGALQRRRPPVHQRQRLRRRGQTCDLVGPRRAARGSPLLPSPQRVPGAGAPVTAAAGLRRPRADSVRASTRRPRTASSRSRALNLCRDSSDLTCLLRTEALRRQGRQRRRRPDRSLGHHAARHRAGVELPIGLDGTSGARHDAASRAAGGAWGPSAQPVIDPPTAPSVTPVVAAAGQLRRAALRGAVGERRQPARHRRQRRRRDLRSHPARLLPRRVGRRTGFAKWRARRCRARGSARCSAPRRRRASSRVRARSRRSRAAASRSCSPAIWLYFLLDDAGNAAQAPVARADVTNANPARGRRCTRRIDPTVTANGDTGLLRQRGPAGGSDARDRNRGGPDVFCRRFATGATERDQPLEGVGRAGEASLQRPRHQRQWAGVRAVGQRRRWARLLREHGVELCSSSTRGHRDRPQQGLRRLPAQRPHLRDGARQRDGDRWRSLPARPEPAAWRGAGTFAAFASDGALAAADVDGKQSDVYVTPIRRRNRRARRPDPRRAPDPGERRPSGSRGPAEPLS